MALQSAHPAPTRLPATLPEPAGAPVKAAPGARDSLREARHIDAYVPPAARQSAAATRLRAAPLRQGEQRAAKDIGGTIMNSFIFGFFASCGAAAFGAARNACC